MHVSEQDIHISVVLFRDIWQNSNILARIEGIIKVIARISFLVKNRNNQSFMVTCLEQRNCEMICQILRKETIDFGKRTISYAEKKKSLLSLVDICFYVHAFHASMN